MYLRLTVLASLWVVLVAGCMPSAKRFYEEGLREYRLGHYQNAAGCFRSALERDPEKQEAAYYLARCARNWAERDYANGEYLSAMRHLDEAVQYYDQAIEAYPGYSAALREKADALRLKGQYDEALKQNLWAKNNAGRTVGQLAKVAREYELRGDFDRALVTYRQAIAVEPSNPLAHAELGRFFIRVERYGDAAVALERAYGLSPAEPGVATDLAMARGLSGAPAARTAAADVSEGDAASGGGTAASAASSMN